MANRSGLIALVHGVRAYFAANSITANVAACGWRQRSEQMNQGPGRANRVLFIPGDMNGRGGSLANGPRLSSTNPRPLVQWNKLVTLSVWAADPNPANRADEEKQIEAVETLLEQTIQAMRYALDPDTEQRVGFATIEFHDLTWTVDNTEMYFGREVLVTFTHKGPLFDVTYDTGTPDPAVNRGSLT